MSYERLMKSIKTNYQIKKEGGYNYIPVGFNRFKNHILGIVRSTQTIVTASSGVGKSKFTRYFFVQKALEFVYDKPDIKLRIIIFSLELSAEEYIADILCSFLKRDYGINITYRELLSVGDNDTLTEDVIAKLDEYSAWVDYFKKHVVIFTSIRNPTGIYKEVLKIIKRDFKGSEKEVIDENGNKEIIYEYEEEGVFIEVIIDHISLLTQEKHDGILLSPHQTISKMSSDYCLELKNKYQTCNIIVQQQAAAKEAVEYNYSGKSIDDKLEPSLDGLGDNKLTQRDATDVIGIFAPNRYEIAQHPKLNGYNIGIMKDSYRSIKKLKDRYGSPNVKIGMYFDGAVGTFEELPKIDEFDDNKCIKFLKERREEKPIKKKDKETKQFKFNFNSLKEDI